MKNPKICFENEGGFRAMGQRAESKSVMEIYVQNVRTGEFFDGNGWCKDESKAFAFASGLAALNFCQTLPKDTEVIMRFGGTVKPGLRVTENVLR